VLGGKDVHQAGGAGRGDERAREAARVGMDGDGGVGNHEGGLGEPRRAGLTDHREEILQRLGAQRAHGMDFAARPRREQRRRIGARAPPPVALDVIDMGATRFEHLAQVLPSAFAPEHDDPFPLHGAQLRQGEQRLAVMALPR
jgi:hypothetical protein